MATSEMEEQANVAQHHHHQQHQQTNGVHHNGHPNGSSTGVPSSDLKARLRSVQFQTTASTTHSRVSSSSSYASAHSRSSSYSSSSSSSSSSPYESSTYNSRSLTAWSPAEYLVHGTVLALIVAHILVAPYTKVEESFNLQATHDILTFGVSSEDVKQYDHLEFPGVVPRTFVGPLLLAAGSWPFITLARLLAPASGVPKGLAGQIIVRMVLGLFTFAGWHQMSRGIRHQFGRMTSLLFMMVSAVQFHWLFYAGRTLPNTFALTIVNVAYSYWMQASAQRSRYFTETRLLRMIDCLVLATVLFRSEILLLLGPIVLLELSLTRIRLIPTILEGLKAGVFSLLVAIAIDSWFWQQWMWAEGAVFYFNAVQGKSVAWGISPWHTYFTSLLPKISGVALPLALLAVIVESRFRRYMLPVAVFVSIYSALGHKEWRFVVYAVPILNLGAAITLSWIIKRKTLAYRLLSVVVFAALGLSFLASVFQSLISSHNYPGGKALQRLHELELPHFSAATVHIDGAAAETGCSRFGEIALAGSPLAPKYPWTYSKDESHTTRRDYLHYTHLLTATPCFHKHDFDILEQVDGYAGIARVQLQQIKERCPGGIKKFLSSPIAGLSKVGIVHLWKACSPVQIKTEGKIWIMRRCGAA